MHADRLQTQRFEIKYLVPDSIASSARDFVRAYLDADEFSATRADFSYPVHSLYLDSDEMTFYRHTLNGDKNRLKMRARFYDQDLDSPVFLEIKRRTNNTISKQRCAIRREALWTVLSGQLPEPSMIVSKGNNATFALHNFLRLLLAHQAKPVAHVGYRREAWVSRADNSLRVTMDRNVRFDVQAETLLKTGMKEPVPVFDPEVVLELKFTNRCPEWFEQLARVFNLRQYSAAKYAEGVTLFGRHRMKNRLNQLRCHACPDGRVAEAPAGERS